MVVVVFIDIVVVDFRVRVLFGVVGFYMFGVFVVVGFCVYNGIVVC